MLESRVLLSGLQLGESPRWHDDRLWLSDWGAQHVVAVDLDGQSEVMLDVPAFPFSFDWLSDGRLLVVAGSDRRVLRQEPGGELVEHADLSGISDRPWNEIVVDARGNAYVNGIGFDLMSGEPPGSGVIALVTVGGSAREVARDFAFPNGMALTPDGATLMVAESYANCLTAFDVAGDGTLSNRRVWAGVGDGAPDGICLDEEGAVWYADVPNRRCVRVREGGAVLDTVEVDRGCFACMLGGPDGRTLFVVAAEWSGTEGAGTGEPTGQVLVVPAPAPHAGRP